MVAVPSAVLLLTVLLPATSGQDHNCPQLQFSLLGNTTAFSNEGLLADALVAAGETDPSIQIIAFNKVCLGQGTIRDTYRSISIVMVYRNASNSTEVTVQVEYSCMIGAVWSVLLGNNGAPSIMFDPSATLTTEKRMDCSFCINPAVGPTAATISNLEHCAACNLCPPGGLGRCTGFIFDQVCCNYFDMSGACVETCNPNSLPETTNFECQCVPGYQQVNSSCEEINECDPDPCQNGGNCTDLIDDFSCVCGPSFTGNNCTTIIDTCYPNHCENEGNCTALLDDFSCACGPSFTGRICTTSIDTCYPNPCENEGNCTALLDDFSCACGPSFTGNNCTTIIDTCYPNPCENEGNCTADLMDSYSCDCAPGYGGRICNVSCDENCEACSDTDNTCEGCGDSSGLIDYIRCEILPLIPDNKPIIIGVAVAAGIILLALTICIILILSLRRCWSHGRGGKDAL